MALEKITTYIEPENKRRLEYLKVATRKKLYQIINTFIELGLELVEKGEPSQKTLQEIEDIRTRLKPPIKEKTDQTH